ncbi:MAG: glutamate synthase subunit beta [Acidobacteria bacterium]|nr:glutamate synthase subunit beta [Acidobacteriota bacterium]
MGKVTGFIEYDREKFKYRPVEERLHDYREVTLPAEDAKLKKQAARCMDCGIPFCHMGCPLGNLIPDWNDLVYRDRWSEAITRLHSTNNFPEFTGRLCPAPCEGSCVLGINNQPVTIKQVEVSIIERAFESGFVKPFTPTVRTGKKVAVVGSGPAGLATADQLNKAGHLVTVFERADRVGGLMRYGIPEFKMEKNVLNRRLALMEQAGVIFRTSANIGVNVPVKELQKDFDAIVLAGGATAPRDLPIPGRELKGIYYAMDFLPLQNKKCEGDTIPDAQFISAEGKRVVIIGGGDTGADCLGTVHRQGCKSVHQLELLPKPPDARDVLNNPWPLWPNIFRTSSAHDEGGIREYSISTKNFSGVDGVVKKLHTVQVKMAPDAQGRLGFVDIPGTEMEIEADLVLLAMGFLGPEKKGMLDQFGVKLTERGNVARDANWMTNVPGVFTAGDMQRGQSLIVWAIAEGRSAARGVDTFLMGRSDLPAPLA